MLYFETQRDPSREKINLLLGRLRNAVGDLHTPLATPAIPNQTRGVISSDELLQRVQDPNHPAQRIAWSAIRELFLSTCVYNGSGQERINAIIEGRGARHASESTAARQL